MPSEGKILFLLDAIRKASRKGIEANSDSERINKMIAWNSRSVMKQLQDQEEISGCRVSLSDTYTRAYFSHGRNCKYSRNCIYDCPGMYLREPKSLDFFTLGVLRPFWDNPFLSLDTS